AAAAVAGFAGSGVMVVAKHLCAQGHTTGGLNASAAPIGRRELLEIHLPAAEAACRAGAMGFMAAYNEIDGIPCHANPWLLRSYLRDGLGFTGIVMADGTALDKLDILTGDSAASAALGLASGVDVSLWDNAFPSLPRAVADGLVEERLVDEAALRVLTLKMQSGLFDKPLLDEGAPPYVPQIGRQQESLVLARHSVVLLENRGGLLPLVGLEGKTIALIGPAGRDLYQMSGDYTPPLTEGETLAQGLRALLPPGARLLSEEGCGMAGAPGEAAMEAALAAAAASDVVILSLGGTSSRYHGARFDNTGAVTGADLTDADDDTAATGADDGTNGDGAIAGAGAGEMDCGEGADCAHLKLPGGQAELAARVLRLGRPVIVVITAGRPYAIADIAPSCGALLYAFYPGPGGGRALAEILLGVAPPAGRLPVSLPRGPGLLPCYYNRKAGYGDDSYRDTAPGPLYPFGYGLSGGAQFVFGELAAQPWRGGIRLTGNIKNAGETTGWAVPMLFLRWLRGACVPRIKELKAFEKIKLLPGESRSIGLEVGEETLQRYDAALRKTAGGGPARLTLEEGGRAVWTIDMELVPAVGRGIPDAPGFPS
ncbi:MAG: glycoside hydrolase family 3 C-terminal domain-containing protein, partial [Oscillospiraceae bacterium]|nr:glycoside hydrolase family 3 C-terminal domain-containing protein [Oscillospiraceae bacterium]